MTGLRERKKLQTRQEIADAAARLFRDRGFDDVTVEEVAEAAGVSKKTVFNYFATKEDLVFDRFEEREAGLIAAVRDRPDGVSVLESFRKSSLDYCDQLARQAPDFQRGGLFGLIESSPVLARRWHQVRNHYSEVLSSELAAEAGVDADDPLASAVASALLGAQRAIMRASRKRQIAGNSPAEVAASLRPQVHRIYDQLAVGIGDYPPKRPALRTDPASVSPE
jgi:AcrR family transcriptional regulator